MIYQCIECSGEVTSRHHAIACDTCGEWQHRRCKSGISLDDYRTAVREGESLDFICKFCRDLIPEREVEYDVTQVDDDVDCDAYMETTAVDVPNADTNEEQDKTSDDQRAHSTLQHITDDDLDQEPTIDVRISENVTFQLGTSFDLNTTGDNDADTHIPTPPRRPTYDAERSFAVDRSFDDPQIITERSLHDPQPPSTPTQDQPLTFEIITGGSQKGKYLLSDSNGYTYVVKEIRGRSRKWRCSVRNNNVSCPAGVVDKSGSFQANSKQHLHAPDPVRGTTAKVTQKAKSVATNDLFKSAAIIVSESKTNVESLVNVGVLHTANIARTVNRHRENNRPEEPKDMDFELNKDALPNNFYRREVIVNRRRHLIFATDEQLSLLKQSRRWYVDGTFKVTRKPFSMLLSIHAFVRRGECSKQIPLIYVLMSDRKTSDYAKVFQTVRRGLEEEQCVEEVVCDFEVALWNATRRVFGVTIRGCVFHWGQAVWKHVQSLGLSTEYMQEQGTYTFIRKLFCLPFLPEEHIAQTFHALRDLNGAAHLIPLLDYIEDTWFLSPTWTVANWCVYGQSVRTNNDCEGWHRRLNGRAGVAPPFYVLVGVLHAESCEAGNQVQLVSEMRLRRHQRKAYRTMQSMIFATWDRCTLYREGQLTATGLLKKMSTIYMPRITKEQCAHSRSLIRVITM